MKIEALTSARNPLLKSVRRAIARGTATEDGCAVAEGFHLLEEAIASGCDIQAVLVSTDARDSIAIQAGAHPVYPVEAKLFGEIATTETTQGVITLVRVRPWTLPQTIEGAGPTVVLDGVQEPGNAGAIARAAEAFGATGMLFLKGSVSPFNPKSLRASAGSLFRLPFVHNVEEVELRALLDQHRRPLFAAMPDGTVPLHQADLTRPCVLIIGSEGRGVRPELSRDATSLRIPTERVESLNAAVAAAVVLYEAQRQRKLG